jgi:SAM-dependent methyltransferase
MNMQPIQEKHQNGGCPVCLTYEAQPIWRVNSDQAAQHFVLKEKSPERFFKLMAHIESLWGQGYCEVLKCKNCGFYYSSPYVAGDEKFYSLAYDRDGYPSWKWEFQLTYLFLRNSFDKSRKLLEIGAGDGAFIKKIADKIILKENILCTEFSDYGRRKIEEFGVNCSLQDFRDISNAEFGGKFDFICMFQVLEHIDRLEFSFQKLNTLLKSGGSLFVSVPNPSRIEFNELHGALLDMPPNHIGRWNRKSFEKIGEKSGFKIIDYNVEKPIFFSMAMEFIVFRFLRKSQKSGSLENRILQIQNRHYLKIVQFLGLLINSILAIPILLKMSTKNGNSIWVHFIKNN